MVYISQCYLSIRQMLKRDLDYKDCAGQLNHASRDEVRLLRYVYKNSFVVYFRVHNDGDARATGVRVKLSFNDLLVLSEMNFLNIGMKRIFVLQKTLIRIGIGD